MKINIGTFNILNTSCRYQERKHLVKETIEKLDCDILGLQEVNFNQNIELFDLEKYNIILGSLPQPMLKPDPDFRIDGNAILLKKSWEVISEDKLVYSTQDRIAQILKIKKNDTELLVVNTHLDHLSDNLRMIQVSELLAYLCKIQANAIVCTGDFNFLPSSEPYNEMQKVFSSACLTVLKKEPQITFPTGLIGKFSDLDEYGCFDYIWYKGQVIPQNCSVIRDCGNGSLWASDHYPIVAQLKLT